jgi:sodium transport system permease protein
VLFAGMMNFAMNRDEAVQNDPLSIAVAHGERAPNLLRFLNSRGIDQHHAYDDAAARHAVSTKRHKLVLLVPEDYARRLRVAEPASCILLYVDQSVHLMVGDATRRVRDTLAGLRPQHRARTAHFAWRESRRAGTARHPQTVDVSTPVSRAGAGTGLLSYFVILAMLMGGLNLAIDSTAGERERGSLEALLTTPSSARTSSTARSSRPARTCCSRCCSPSPPARSRRDSFGFERQGNECESRFPVRCSPSFVAAPSIPPAPA